MELGTRDELERMTDLLDPGGGVWILLEQIKLNMAQTELLVFFPQPGFPRILCLEHSWHQGVIQACPVMGFALAASHSTTPSSCSCLLNDTGSPDPPAYSDLLCNCLICFPTADPTSTSNACAELISLSVFLSLLHSLSP